MGLLFVPAGVGVIVEFGVLRQNWLPILAGLLLSTILGLIVTGLVMHHVSRIVEGGRRRLPLLASQQETP
jgi:holin-like protein